MADDLTREPSSASMLDPFQVWKKMFFSFEDSLSKTVRDSVTTDGFSNGIDWILNSYLQYLKLQKEFVNTYMDETPFPSKRDIARVAELVVSLEHKLDGLEGEIKERLDGIGSQSVTMAHRLSDLEKTVTRIEAKLNAADRPMKAEAKQNPPAAPGARVPKSKSSPETA